LRGTFRSLISKIPGSNKKKVASGPISVGFQQQGEPLPEPSRKFTRFNEADIIAARYTASKMERRERMNILWIVNTNTFLLVLLVIMVSYLTAQLNTLIRWLRRE
jgi:hypothetical protein